MNVVIKASDIDRTDFRSASEIWVAPLNEALAPEDTEQSLCLWRGEPVVTHDMLSEGPMSRISAVGGCQFPISMTSRLCKLWNMPCANVCRNSNWRVSSTRRNGPSSSRTLMQNARHNNTDRAVCMMTILGLLSNLLKSLK
jgi:hypothetical protein